MVNEKALKKWKFKKTKNPVKKVDIIKPKSIKPPLIREIKGAKKK